MSNFNIFVHISVSQWPSNTEFPFQFVSPDFQPGLIFNNKITFMWNGVKTNKSCKLCYYIWVLLIIFMFHFISLLKNLDLNMGRFFGLTN